MIRVGPAAIFFTVPTINPVSLLYRGDKGGICGSFCELHSTILLVLGSLNPPQRDPLARTDE